MMFVQLQLEQSAHGGVGSDKSESIFANIEVIKQPRGYSAFYGGNN